ncbi:MAG: prepilin-type N-terminal cleavage/methylation domain-containing protein [Myxococcota bacterium]
MRPAQRTWARQAGLTLVELMVVVAIVGILMVTAVVTIDREPMARDMANRVANMMRETSRKGVARGPIDFTQVDSPSSPAVTWPTQLRVFNDAGTGYWVVAIERYNEVPNPDEWVEIERRFISHTGVEIVGYSDSAEFSASPSPPTTTLGIADEKIIRCHEDGSCDATTLYLEKGNGERARMVVMPLSGTAEVYDGW